MRGAVVVARYAGSRPFSRTDVEMAEQLALHAALALELADGRRDEARVAMLEDRHRIARDLHDHVIQRIFATELTLEAVTGRATDPAVREALGRAIEDLDETIRRIRTAIFTLQKPRSSMDARAVLLEVVRSSTAGLGFEPTLRLEGPVATVLDPPLLHDVTAVLRESLTNVVKHVELLGRRRPRGRHPHCRHRRGHRRRVGAGAEERPTGWAPPPRPRQPGEPGTGPTR